MAHPHGRENLSIIRRKVPLEPLHTDVEVHIGIGTGRCGRGLRLRGRRRRCGPLGLWARRLRRRWLLLLGTGGLWRRRCRLWPRGWGSVRRGCGLRPRRFWGGGGGLRLRCLDHQGIGLRDRNHFWPIGIRHRNDGDLVGLVDGRFELSRVQPPPHSEAGQMQSDRKKERAPGWTATRRGGSQRHGIQGLAGVSAGAFRAQPRAPGARHAPGPPH